MPKFKVEVHYVTSIIAEDEEEAEQIFFDREINDTQSNAETWLSDYVCITEIKNKKKKKRT